jgi:hypothetical protein
LHLLQDTDMSLKWRRLREYAGSATAGDQAMSPFTHVVDGLLGLAAVSSFVGFVFHLLTGNPDLALMCFVGIGGSAAMVWMFSTWRRA